MTNLFIEALCIFHELSVNWRTYVLKVIQIINNTSCETWKKFTKTMIAKPALLFWFIFCEFGPIMN
jgi:hypothetical protein